MPEKKNPLKSRKWWTALLTTLLMIIEWQSGIDLNIKFLTAQLVPICLWIVSEAITDGVVVLKKKG